MESLNVYADFCDFITPRSNLSVVITKAWTSLIGFRSIKTFLEHYISKSCRNVQQKNLSPLNRFSWADNFEWDKIWWWGKQACRVHHVGRYPYSVCTQMYLLIFMGYFEPREMERPGENFCAINKSKLFALLTENMILSVTPLVRGYSYIVQKMMQKEWKIERIPIHTCLFDFFVERREDEMRLRKMAG